MSSGIIALLIGLILGILIILWARKESKKLDYKKKKWKEVIKNANIKILRFEKKKKFYNW